LKLFDKVQVTHSDLFGKYGEKIVIIDHHFLAARGPEGGGGWWRVASGCTGEKGEIK